MLLMKLTCKIPDTALSLSYKHKLEYFADYFLTAGFPTDFLSRGALYQQKSVDTMETTWIWVNPAWIDRYGSVAVPTVKVVSALFGPGHGWNF